MYKVMKKQFLLLAIALSFAGAFFARGFSPEFNLSARSSFGRLEGVSNDGWISKQASIEFPKVAPFLNRVVLSFNAWRPASAGNALITVASCGAKVGEFAITNDEPIRLKLKNGCDPQQITIEVKNPFNSGGSDGRLLGIKLVNAQIRSVFFMPITAFSDALEYFAAILALTVLLMYLFPLWQGILALLIPIIVTSVLTTATPIDAKNLDALWVVVMAFLTGGVVYHLFPKRESTQILKGRSEFVILMVIVAVGAILRFYGIDFGLPAMFHPDETPKVNAIMRMVQRGDLNPEYFLHPSLLLYLTYFTNTVLQWVGFPGEFQDSLRLSGRIVSALAGTGSLALLFYLGRTLYTSGVGLLAAGLLAVFPLHVTCSRYMKEDALMLFFVLAVALAVSNAVKKQKPGLLIVAGVLAGFATGVKYSGFLTSVIVASAPWLVSRSWKPDYKFLKFAAIGCFIIPFAFVITTPYSVLDFDSFYKGFSNERKHMLRGHTVSISAWSQYWMYHFTRSIVPGMNSIVAVVSLVGIGLLAFRRRIEDLFIVGLVLLFYLPAEWVRAKPAPQPERYIVPCLPFLALGIAELLRFVSNKLPRAATGSLIVALCALPLYRSLRLANEVNYDTRIKMARWIEQNIPKGSKIRIDWMPYSAATLSKDYILEPFPSGKMMKGLQLKELKANDSDYLLMSSLVHDRFFSQPQTDALRRSVIRNVFDKVPIVKEISPEYETYGFHNPKLTLFSLKDLKVAGAPAVASDDDKNARASLKTEAPESDSDADTDIDD
jgi:4-amino-4-deoxy-L-arabinose transferase-like glycosyltransferase